MTVDQIPLPSISIRPPPAPWPATGSDHSNAEPNRPREDEPPSEATGWPRVFPGL